MLEPTMSSTTGKPIKRLYLNVGQQAYSLINAVAEISDMTVDQLFIKSLEPVARQVIEDLEREPDANISYLSEISSSLDQVFLDARIVV